MPFQALLDPFSYALQTEGARLQNDGRALDNAIKLDELKMQRLRFDAMTQDMVEAGKSAHATQSVPAPGLADANRGGAAQEGDPQPVPAPSTAMMQNAAALKATVDRLKKTFADPSKVAVAQQEYNNAYKAAVEQQDKEFTQRAPFLERVSDALYRMKENPAVGAAEIARLRQEQPPGMNLDAYLYGDDTKGQGLGLKRGIGGVPIPDPQKLAQASANSKLVKEAYERDYKERKDKEEQQRLAQADERLAIAERAATRAETAAREGTVTRAERDKAKKEAADTQFVTREMKDLHSSPVYKNWDEYQLGVGKAMNIAETVRQKGYAAFTTTDASMLVAAMRDQQNRYRARLGGTSKAEDQQMDHLNGLIRGFEKYITSIGEGDKKLAFETLGEATRSMYNVGMLRNEQVVRETLKHVQKLANHGLADKQADLEGEGDVNALHELGWLKSEVKDGKKYVIMRSQLPNAKGQYEMSDRYYIGEE